MKKIVILSIVTSSLVMAGAYKVPEQSINSMALGAAYIAHTTGADSAYFNPANMSFLSDKQHMEAGLTLAHLPENRFRGVQAFSATEFHPADGKSETENLLLPYLHYVSKPIGDMRWGASLTVPGGLTKRWETPYQKLFAEEFTLKVIELNPVISYKIADNFAIGGGARFIYSEGVVNSDGGEAGKAIKREMEGNTVEYGYNLAMTYKPTSNINLAATYRSNIDLAEDGQANLYIGEVGKQFDAKVTVPLPAALNLAISKTWADKVTLEFVYERTYWSAYESLDFKYASPIQPALVSSFDDLKARNWKDTDTFRVGATIEMSNDITFMVGYAKDETPAPKENISYELPDTDAELFSMGIRVKATDAITWGLAYLHDEKESITLMPGDNHGGIIGSFSGGGADLFTAGVTYEF